MTTLHVTNGDSVGGSLLQAGFSDAVLPWRDVLHDGPVPGGLDAEALRNVRAQFLAGRGWTSFETALADLAGRDAQFAAMGAGDKIVLWFEPDVYDQLQLLQILARCYIKPAGERPVLTIVASDELLGPLAPDKLAKYADTERTVREVDLELAAAGWEAFTNSEPVLLRNFAGTETELFSANSYAADAAIVLPHVHAAMRRLLQEYPSLANGLSRTEQQIVDVLMSGARTVADTYAAAHAPKEELVWLGDWSFAWYVERMMLARIPLLEFEDGSGMVVGLAQTDHAKFWKNPVRLTEAGKAVALGTSHAIGLNGIDRWIGGVHLAYSNLHDDLRVMLR